MERLIERGSLMAPKEVLSEVKRHYDHLADWANAHRDLFQRPSRRQTEFAWKILEKYPHLVDEGKMQDADAWVIALAAEPTENPQQTMSPVIRMAVTEEKIKGNKTRIPFICRKYNIKAINRIDMFRIEGWRF